MRAMLVREIGEFQLIDTLARAIVGQNAECIKRLDANGFRLRLSIGDDAAAWDGPDGARVLTTDTMVEGVHFDLGRTSWRDLGWKLMAVNLSDVAAMGCAPLFSVITLGLHGDLPVDGLVEMYRGMLEACHMSGGAIVGGDIVRSPVFFLTAALEGTSVVPDKDGAPPRVLLTRDSAAAGDKIAVTGSLGCSAGGLRMFIEGAGGVEARAYDSETADHLKAAHNRPAPRVPQGIALARHGVSAAMDISDGLVDDLDKLCKASGVRAAIHADRVPADAFLRRAYPNDWLALALAGGEDYELLFTARERVIEAVAPLLDLPVSVIGDVVEGTPEVLVLDLEGNPTPIEQGGWDHFRQR